MGNIVYYIELVGNVGELNERNSVLKLGPFDTAPLFNGLGDYMLPGASHGEGRIYIGLRERVVYTPFAVGEPVIRCDYMRVVAEVA